MTEYDASPLLEKTVSNACGWCGQPSWFRLRSSAMAGRDQNPWRPREVRPLISAIYQCSGCERPTLFIYEVLNAQHRDELLSLKWTFPQAFAQPMDLLPDPIEADRVEAWNCYEGGLHRASILMARSALQRAVRYLSEFRGSLNAELDNLVDEGFITKQLRKNADEVRLTGNDVAHPEDLKEVTKEDAEDSLVFLDDFLETTIEIPARQRRRSDARQVAPEEQSHE